MNIIEEIYYGNVVPNETNAKLSAELKELLKLLNRNEDNLIKSFSEEQKITFEKYKDCYREISEISERESFMSGFQLGARIIIEVVNE